MDKDKFGFLGTDEEIAKAGRKSDFERSVLGGCVSFSLASAAQLAAIAVPMLTARSLFSSGDLFEVLAVYLAVAAVVGILATWLAGLTGFLGSVAGLVPAATFLWLRLRDAVTGVPGIEGMQPAEYPAAYAWAAPLLCSVVLGLMFAASFAIKGALARRAG